MDLWRETQQELERYKETVGEIRRRLISCEDECARLIGEIANRTFDDAQPAFDRLHDLQGHIATAKYKYEFPLSDRQSELVRHLDRDDLPSRKYWYQRFRDGLRWPDE